MSTPTPTGAARRHSGNKRLMNVNHEEIAQRVAYLLSDQATCPAPATNGGQARQTPDTGQTPLMWQGEPVSIERLDRLVTNLRQGEREAIDQAKDKQRELELTARELRLVTQERDDLARRLRQAMENQR